jgi:hypothetical protein
LKKGKLLGGAVAIVVLGGVLWLSIPASGGSAADGSVAGRDPAGRLAALALLQELDYDARPFERPPGYLPPEPGLCWLPRVPFERASAEPADSSERSDVDLATELGPEHAPEAYRHFVAQGGTLVVAAGPGVGELLAEHFGIAAVRDLVAPSAPAMSEIAVPWSSAETLTLEWPDSDPLTEIARTHALDPWFADTNGRVLALLMPVESGRVVCSPRRLRQCAHPGRRCRGPPHALDRLAPSGPILFDEYSLGRWIPRSGLEVAFGPYLGVLSVQLLLLLGFFAWRHTWVREFPRDPPALAALSPLARASAIASLRLRAGRPEEFARVLTAEVLRDIARGLHCALPERGAAGDGSSETAARDEHARETLALVLERMGWSSERPALEQRIFAPVRGAADLERVHAELVALEERVSAAGASAVRVLA